jgi:predicted enzyme related to lactoylglutathione lyase
VARAQKLGASVVAPRTEIKDVGWFAVLQDPSGVRIGVFEKAAAAER